MVWGEADGRLPISLSLSADSHFAAFAVSLAFDLVLIWWLLVPVAACFIGWRLTRNSKDRR
jgi:hypothetical protein